jgi:hypothetical protein
MEGWENDKMNKTEREGGSSMINDRMNPESAKEKRRIMLRDSVGYDTPQKKGLRIYRECCFSRRETSEDQGFRRVL